MMFQLESYHLGTTMPNRTYSSDKYRFGFNGKENDNEIQGTGNSQDYGMRIYDPRIVRFNSVDPIAKKYPELTPYQFASNRMIDGIDQDGLEYIGYKVISINTKGQCQIKMTGRVDYKNWLLNATNGFGGRFKLPVASIEYNGKHYLFDINNLNNINVKDFNNDRPTEEGIDALFTLTSILGSATSTGKGNEVVNTTSDVLQKFEEISTTVKEGLTKSTENKEVKPDTTPNNVKKETKKAEPKEQKEKRVKEKKEKIEKAFDQRQGSGIM